MAADSGDPLQRYRDKRDFGITPEPAEGGSDGANGLTFVIQKHWARALHYDFRLELDGTMKSWAVPKGPSLDASDKRMAVQVEDHPVSYSGFEGTIPPKQYGAGTVIVWDRGTWHPLGDPQLGYRDGNLKFELHGHKLRGKWVLVRMKGKGEKQPPWLLIKEKDEFVRASAEYKVVDELPDSVNSLPWPGAPAKAAEPATKRPKSANSGARARRAGALPAGALRVALPATLAPQLATLVDAPPRDPASWLYEIKFDGYRMLARIDAGKLAIFTRNGHDWTARLTPLHRALASMKLPPGWYDGEVVVPNDQGVPDFGALQRSFESGVTGDVVYYLFDLPFVDGHDLRKVPLNERRALLRELIEKSASDRVRFSEAFDALPQQVLGSACKLGLEGVIAKRRDSVYVSRRSADWIKLKCGLRQEFVIGGFTEPRGTRTGVGALLLGVPDEHGALRYAGNVGTGFDQRSLVDLSERLGALVAATRPFAGEAAIEGRPRWVRPELVADVSFAEWTRAGRIRHAVFHGLRNERQAGDIMREPESLKAKDANAGAAAPSRPKPLSSRLRITNPQRVIDPASGLTKIDLVRYFERIGALMMVHLKGRPVSMLRAPNGVGGEHFFQKHAETDKLPGLRQLDPALDPGHPAMLEVTGVGGLLAAAQWNVVEFHTLNTGTKSFAHPDRMVFDLDPGEGVPWSRVQEAAQLVHAFLDQLGLASFLKTSGGKGLHVVVPLRKIHDWDTVKGFSRAVVLHLAKTVPQRFVAKSGPRNRVGKVFIDYLRNGLGATTVAAWSARARPGLGVSAPVEWSELESLRGGDHWTVRNAGDRVDRGNQPWTGYTKAAKGLSVAIKTLGWSPDAA